jgi:hypothetical protein
VSTGRTSHAVTCEIVLGRRLGERSLRGFEGFDAINIPGDGMRLVGHVADQAALHGVLAAIRDLGVPLVSVRLHDDQDCDGG